MSVPEQTAPTLIDRRKAIDALGKYFQELGSELRIAALEQGALAFEDSEVSLMLGSVWSSCGIRIVIAAQQFKMDPRHFAENFASGVKETFS